MSGILQTLIYGVSVVKDAYFNLVTLLLNTTTTNGAQNNTFLDSSSNNFSITRNGNTTQGTFTPFSQTGWGVFAPGTTGNYYSGTTNLWATNTSTFTVDGWINPTSYAAASGVIIGDCTPNGATLYIAVMLDATGKIRLEWYDGGSKVCTGSTTVPLNSWSYFAVRVSSNAISIYVNSSSADTLTGTTTLTNRTSTTNFSIAQYNNSPNNSYAGYISNLRFSTIARTISVPTAAFASDADTKLLTFQSNRVVDNSPSPLTINQTGTPSVQAFSPFAPTAAYSTSVVGGSGYFDGTGDYLSVPDNAAFTMGAGDFCLEAWVYVTAASGAQAIYGTSNSAGSQSSMSFLLYAQNSSGFPAIGVGYAGTMYYATSSEALTKNQWNHIAGVRNGATVSIYVNGVSRGTLNMAALAITDSAEIVGIGRNGNYNGEYLTGYIASARIIKGSPVYTANFTPPTAPLTAITNTQLLTNFTNAGIFDATSKNDLETVGNAQVSTTQAKFGTTSMYFDGTGDYLIPNYQAITSNAPMHAFGTGDFTIEAWVYSTVAMSGSLVFLFDFRPTTTNGSYASLYFDNTGTIYYVNSAARITGSVLSANTWTHIAICRSGTNTKLFINGTQSGSTFTDSTNYVSYEQRPAIASSGFGVNTSLFTGYIDEFRITKGYARYTANFTAPTAAFPVQ